MFLGVRGDYPEGGACAAEASFGFVQLVFRILEIRGGGDEQDFRSSPAALQKGLTTDFHRLRIADSMFHRIRALVSAIMEKEFSCIPDISAPTTLSVERFFCNGVYGFYIRTLDSKKSV